MREAYISTCERDTFGGVNCHEIEGTVIFYVAAFGGLGSSPDQLAEQHVAIRIGLGSNHPDQPKFPDFYAWNCSA